MKSINKDECKSFPLLWMNHDKNNFIVFKIEEDMCDTLAKKKVIEVKTFCYLNGKIFEDIQYVKTDIYKGLLISRPSMIVASEDGVHEKMLDSDEDYICGNCGETKEKMQRCSICKLTYYCGRKCQKTDWKFHKKVCGR
uniref:MYND finger protein n=1 Tax=Pithovirus LCPAC406 TaxID=2506599 RepID=A0A481ZDK4_9VIRU|nr:MAG: MYND finger protein [Pithovirus LCPAC406]